MKRTLSCLIMLSLLVTLVACKGNSQENNESIVSSENDVQISSTTSYVESSKNDAQSSPVTSSAETSKITSSISEKGDNYGTSSNATNDHNEKKSNTPEETVNKFLSAFNAGNAEKLLECVPDFMVKKLSNEFGISASSKKDLISSVKKEINGFKYSLNYEIAEITIDERETTPEGINSQFREGEYPDEVMNKFEEYCEVQVELEGFDGVGFECVKYEGAWYIIYADL